MKTSGRGVPQGNASPRRGQESPASTQNVGVFAGWLVFGDAITPAFAAAIALVVVGLALVTRPGRRG